MVIWPCVSEGREQLQRLSVRRLGSRSLLAGVPTPALLPLPACWWVCVHAPERVAPSHQHLLQQLPTNRPTTFPTLLLGIMALGSSTPLRKRTGVSAALRHAPALSPLTSHLSPDLHILHCLPYPPQARIALAEPAVVHMPYQVRIFSRAAFSSHVVSLCLTGRVSPYHTPTISPYLPHASPNLHLDLIHIYSTFVKFNEIVFFCGIKSLVRKNI